MRKVAANPMMPLSKKTQPTRMAVASVAISGSMTAAKPRITSTIPSIRKSFQWERSEAVSAVCIGLNSGLTVDIVITFYVILSGIIGRFAHTVCKTFTRV